MVTALQSGCMSPGALQPSVPSALELPVSGGALEGLCLLKEPVQWFLLDFSQCEPPPCCRGEVCSWAPPWESSQLGFLVVVRSWP